MSAQMISLSSAQTNPLVDRGGSSKSGGGVSVYDAGPPRLSTAWPYDASDPLPLNEFLARHHAAYLPMLTLCGGLQTDSCAVRVWQVLLLLLNVPLVFYGVVETVETVQVEGSYYFLFPLCVLLQVLILLPVLWNARSRMRQLVRTRAVRWAPHWTTVAGTWSWGCCRCFP